MLCCDFQNEGIPESDEGPTLEVAQPLSREGTPTGEQTMMDSEGKEEPDASATPPPPESQSPEPVIDLEQMDTYIESGNDVKQKRFKLFLIFCQMGWWKDHWTILYHLHVLSFQDLFLNFKFKY